MFVISKAISFEITYDEMTEMEKQLALFMDWFYKDVYAGNVKRLPTCKYTIHALSHLVDNIRAWGSASYFWQFAEVDPHCHVAYCRNDCVGF